MSVRNLIALASLALLLAACGGGGGGGGGGAPPQGGAYAYIGWTADVVAADFTEAGVPSPFTSGTRYALKVGPATLYWATNYTGSVTYWYLPVQIQGGTATQDRRYDVLISENVLYVTDALVPIGTAAVPGPATPLAAGLRDGRPALADLPAPAPNPARGQRAPER